jgi:large subunit ribosomal protein L29e
MHFAKNHKKGLRKMQADNAKARSADAKAVKALVKPKVVNKHKIPKSANCKLQQFAFIAHSKLGKHLHPYMARGCRLCQPKAKAQAAAPASTVAPAAAQAQLQHRLPKVPKTL